jgi:hypothetical protein
MDNYEAARIIYSQTNWSCGAINHLLRSKVPDLEARLRNDRLLRPSSPGSLRLEIDPIMPDRGWPQAVEFLQEAGWKEPRIKAVLIDNPCPPLNLPQPNFPSLDSLEVGDILHNLRPLSNPSPPQAEREQNRQKFRTLRDKAAKILRNNGLEDWEIDAVLKPLK